MSEGINASDITPGLAIAAAELFHYKKTEELHFLAAAIDGETFSASSIQLVLNVIDWIALNAVGDKIAIAYENDDRETLDYLATQGARFEVTEDGSLNSWIEAKNGGTVSFDFPLEFWTDIKFAVQAHAEKASQIINIPLEVVNHLTAGLINDGVIKLLSGENIVAVPSASNFFKDDPAKANYAVVAINAFITASVMEVAATTRTSVLKNSMPDMDVVTYDDIATVIKAQLLET